MESRGSPEPLLIDFNTLLKLVPLSKSTIEQNEREGRFLRERQLSGRRTAHPYSEVKLQAHDRPVSELPPLPATK